MSSHVYIDTRTRQLRACDAIINQAMQQLDAQKSQISCGQAEVHVSDIDVDATADQIKSTRLQDSVEVADTSGVQNRADEAVADYHADALGDWRPAVQAPAIHVQNGKVDNQSNMKLVEDMQVAAFDGARMLVFEVDDGLGGKSYQIGLETSLFDDDGNWRDAGHKSKYEHFLKQTVAAQRVAMKQAQEKDSVSTQTEAALRAARLTTKSRKEIPGDVTHTVFTNAQKKDTLRTKSVGGQEG